MNAKTTATAREFRAVSSNKDLIEAVADGYATIEGFEATSHPRLVDVRWSCNAFGDGEVSSLMRTSRTTARKLGLAA